jgi:hypothetical protein
MTKPLKRSAADVIAAATAPKMATGASAAAVEELPAKRRNVTKENTKQLTVYLPNPVYRQLREIAFNEDTKMHPLILEGLDMLFKSRNRPQIAREGHGKS